MYGSEFIWRAYGRTVDSVRTGRPAFDAVHGAPLYAYLDAHPDAAAIFHGAMSGFSAREVAAILDAVDVSTARRVVDVGGGHGTLLAAILAAHPALAGVLFDLAPVAEGAARALAAAGLAGRSEVVAGSFFDEAPGIPAGGDVYLLKSVLHNWDDGAAAAILRACRRAMADGARLLVIERVVPEGDAPDEAKLFDVNMLVVAGGCERTAGEYRALLAGADLSLVRLVPTRAPLTVIEAVAAR